MDWEHLFVPGGSLRELMVRGTVLYPKSDLMSQIRQQGIDDVRAVKDAYAEGDGSISVIKARRPRARGHGQEAG
jgi:hypothetical protein